MESKPVQEMITDGKNDERYQTEARQLLISQSGDFSGCFGGQERTVHLMEHRQDEFHETLEEPLLIPGTTVGAQQVRTLNHYTLCCKHESNKQNGVKTRKHNLHVKKALIGKKNNTGISAVNMSIKFIEQTWI